MSFLFDVSPDPVSRDGLVGLILLAVIILGLVIGLLIGFVLLLVFLKRKRAAARATTEPAVSIGMPQFADKE